MVCNKNPPATIGSPTPKLVYSSFDIHDGVGGDRGKEKVDKWRRGRSRSPTFNMFYWFYFFFSSDFDDDDNNGKRMDKLKNGGEMVASMVFMENNLEMSKNWTIWTWLSFYSRIWLLLFCKIEMYLCFNPNFDGRKGFGTLRNF